MISISDVSDKIRRLGSHPSIYWIFTNPLTTALLIVGTFIFIMFIMTDTPWTQMRHIIFWSYVVTVAILCIHNSQISTKDINGRVQNILNGSGMTVSSQSSQSSQPTGIFGSGIGSDMPLYDIPTITKSATESTWIN
jgi:hypothetical protein